MPNVKQNGLVGKTSPINRGLMAVVLVAVVGLGLYVQKYSHAATVAGDVNGDGVVNITDLSLLLAHWNTNYPAADFKADGVINVFDLSVVLSHWGQTTSVTPTPTPAPTRTPAPTPTPVPCGSANGACTTAQVATHNSAGNCWFIYNGSYYDVTGYVNDHPAGPDYFNSSTCGHDVSGYMDGSKSTAGGSHSHSDGAYATLDSFKIGPVK